MPQYATDYPIKQVSEDKFQRGHFSERIAQTIYEYENNKSLVVGLYGKWGSGKSSVLNLIQTHLNIIDVNSKIVVIKFNPWRFSDEKSLLLSFMNVFAKAIDVELKNKKEKLSETISKYADALAIIPLPGINDSVKTVSNIFVQESVEELKLRLDQAIQNTGKKILIIIDDIDRLDRDEIYSILRLVKLNADFPNSIYLLSFDEEMVAETIGERFGEKGKEAGRNFLEKIIQVPLYLPKLLKSDLLSYSFNEISKVINSLGLGISNDDLESFPTYFRECISSRITTPRLVIRYINSISFSLPLLKGEINIADLLLIESVKVFYPNHYQYIKDNTSYFLKQYKAASPFSLESEGIDEATKLIRNALEDLAIDLSHEDKKDIITLLNYIFPQTKSIYANIDNSAMYSDWLKKKRICTSQYYERYFIYAVLKGDLSDIKFDDYLKNISSINLELCGHELYRLIEDSSEEAVLTRLSANQKEFSDEIRNKICLAICSFGNKLTSTHNLSIFLSPQRQYARLVVEIVLNTQTPLEKFKKIFKETHIIFLQHIWDVLVARNDKESFLAKKEIKYLAKEMVKNAQDQAKSTPMFEVDYINTYLIFNLWYEWDNKKFTKYIYNYLEKEPKKVLGILKDSASQILKFGEKDFIRCSITKDNFEFMKKIYDLDYLYKCIEKSFPKQLTQEVIWSRENEEIKDELIYIGQFLHYYKEDKRNEEY